jgi:hypothetical protein
VRGTDPPLSRKQRRVSRSRAPPSWSASARNGPVTAGAARIVGQLGEHRELTQLRPDAYSGETRHATGSPRRELGLPV